MNSRTKNLWTLIVGVVLSLVMITGISRTALAQADLGSITGVVTDTSGAVVPKAAITVTNVATGAVRTAVTSSKGDYSVTQLMPGTYRVKISAAGFAEAEENITVTVGSSNQLSAKLNVAGGKTEVVVQADDFNGVQLDNPEVSTIIDTNQILSLPTLDRNPYNLVAFSGNLTKDENDSAKRGVGFNISGSRSASVDILLDGAENTDVYTVGIGQTVPMDATSEMRVVTSSAGAEYGRGSGAVNVSTKSGTNSIHGSVYEFNRISTLGSAGYNNNYIHAMNPTVSAKPRYTHNQYGYSVGGPIKKDKLFIFSSTEWTKIRSAQNIVATVATPALVAMSSANTQAFFGAYGKLAHPINGSTYTGASSAVQKVFGSDVTAIAKLQTGKTGTGCSDPNLAAAPICTTALFGQSIYTAPADSGGGAPVDQWVSFNRFDWTINNTTQLFVRYIQENALNPVGYVNNSPYDGFDTKQTQFNKGLLVSFSKAITPNLASTTKLLGSRFNNAQPLGKNPTGPTLYTNYNTNVALGGGNLNFPGYSQTTPGNSIPFGGPQNTIQLSEMVTWVKGRHQLTFGGMIMHLKDNRVFGAYQNAVAALRNSSSGSTGALTALYGGTIGYLNVAVDPKGVYPCIRNVSDNKYNDLPGCNVTMPVSSPNFSRSNRYMDGSLFFTDSIKVNSKLTLTAGVRWELYGPQHSQQAAYDANFFPDYSKATIWDQIRAGQVKTRLTAPDGRLWNLNKKQFAPKLGFAYDPFGQGKTSIRGGFGLSYERNFNNVTFNVIQNPPNYAVLAFTNVDNGGVDIPLSTNNFSTFGTGTGTKMLPNTTLRAVDPKIKPSYAANWSLSVEHQVGNTTASLSYVGTRGIHNFSIANFNRSYAGVNYMGDTTGLSNRLNMQYSSINWRGADGDSYYNAATAEVRSQNLLKSGLTIRANYTLAHTIDNTSSTFSDSYNDVNLGYLDPFNPGLDRGNADFDQRHRITAAVIWEIPFAKHSTGLLKTLADNWILSATFDAQTGNPFTYFDCWGGVNACPRTSFVKTPSRKKTSNMKDISSDMGANTYSYMQLPDFYNAAGDDVNPANYNEQYNPKAGDSSDTPICSGLRQNVCSFVKNMDRRNVFRGPGTWHQNLGIVKNIKVYERFELQLKGEFINLYNHANTFLNLNGTNDTSSYTDVLAYKDGNRNTELSLHIRF